MFEPCGLHHSYLIHVIILLISYWISYLSPTFTVQKIRESPGDQRGSIVGVHNTYSQNQRTERGVLLWFRDAKKCTHLSKVTCIIYHIINIRK